MVELQMPAGAGTVQVDDKDLVAKYRAAGWTAVESEPEPEAKPQHRKAPAAKAK